MDEPLRGEVWQDADGAPAKAAELAAAGDGCGGAEGRFGELSSLEDLMGAVEALLFVSDAPVRAATLREMTGAEGDAVALALETLQQRRRLDGSGVVLREVAGGWRLFTSPVYHHLVERYVVSWDTRKLSQAALETLAVVAYLQPVTRAQVASVRGVNSDSPVSSLVEKGLVREVGVADAPGNPGLYGTTKAFLERFGLASAADLPPLELYAPDEETRRLIRERLSASSPAPVVEEGAPADADLGLPETSVAASAEGVRAAAVPERPAEPLELPNLASASEPGADPLAGFVFSEDDEGFEVALADGVPGSLLVEALTSGLGLTEKVSVDTLPREMRGIFDEADGDGGDE